MRQKIKKTMAAAVAGAFIATAGAPIMLAGKANAATSPSNAVIENSTLVFQSTASQTLWFSGVKSAQDYTIKNAAGGTVSSGTLKARQTSLNLKLSEGWYEISVTDRVSKENWTSALMVAPQQRQHQKLGVQVHLSNPSTYYKAWDPKVIPLAKMVGASSLRDDVFLENFTKIPNLFQTPSQVKNEIALAKANGMQMLSIADFSGTYSPKGVGGVPENQEQYAEYASQIVKYLQQNPDVKRVELWNEFNNGMGMNWWQDRSGKKYAELAKAVYPIVKKAHPKVTVVTGVTARYDAPWWGEFFENGGGKASDAYSYHPYGRSEVELTEDSRAIKALSRNHTGVEKPIFISENNWNDLDTMRDTHTTPRGAADRLVISLTQGIADPKVSQVNIYDLINDGPDSALNDLSASEANYGLFRVPNGHVKAYAPKRTAFSTWYLNKNMQSAQGVPTKLGYSNSGKIAIYKLNNNVDVFMQSKLKAQNLPAIKRRVYTSPAKYTTITDSMGKVIVPKGKRSYVDVTIGSSPLYLNSTVR